MLGHDGPTGAKCRFMRLRRCYWLVILLATGCGGAVTNTVKTSSGELRSRRARLRRVRVLNCGRPATGAGCDRQSPPPVPPSASIPVSIASRPWSLSQVMCWMAAVGQPFWMAAIRLPTPFTAIRPRLGQRKSSVRGFVIQNFKTPLQQGAIQDFDGPDWIIQNNHITRNAASGVATGDNVRVLEQPDRPQRPAGVRGTW